jgi:glycosyltransferase involved in cell wall biosynthesis
MHYLDVTFYIFCVITSVQCIYYLLIFGKFSFSKPIKTKPKNVAISVIICAKNEAENLRKNLNSVISQTYPSFEIILINDNSNDATLEVMEDFAEKHSHIKVVNVKSNEAFAARKKFALTLGIKAAKYDYLLFTDADCSVNSSNWISEMSSKFTNTKTIVLGYGSYKKIKNSFLNKLIRYETVLTATQYFSYAKIGVPYMGVGRNLAYRKDEFFSANGFINHMHINSGDDDLFVNQIANSSNTAMTYSLDSFTTSIPKLSYSSWFKQKRRHISTAKHYRTIHKTMLSLFYISQILFWVLGFLLLFTSVYWLIVLGIIFIRCGIQILILGKSSKILGETDLLLVLPFLEFALILSQLAIFTTNIFSKPTHWK